MKNRSFELLFHKQIRNLDGVAPDRVTHHISSWGIQMELLLQHSTRMSHIQYSAPSPFHPDISHPEFCSAAILPGCLTSGILLHRHSTRMSHIRHTPSSDISHPAPDAGWERRVFQLPRSDISKSSDSAYPESFATILHNATMFS